MIRTAFLTAAIAVTVSMAQAEPDDVYDIYEQVEPYDGQPFETSFECLRQSLGLFLGMDVAVDEDESFFHGLTDSYDAIIHFSGERPENEKITVNWIEVLQNGANAIGEHIFQSSSHVNFNTLDHSLKTESAHPFRTNAHNIGHEVDPTKDARVLDALLRSCPSTTILALG